ncbi:hypothetical protein [endosymbiont GvMRE of Glomus versiforme]|uniref:hypothetical protein n=1 Tax=endosymbiont GvMRE of Glomus versiforme TaxID=2039283 RepID=UPI000EBB9D83|nr:hypothetical protein [endosymbiont GvMRE of Glomus versiforme]RHZ36899.1 hypothetical protein GvMRE_I2g241 [endosymbiont GvMRE of Glomus versiforme]
MIVKNIVNLTSLDVNNCHNLVTIKGLENCKKLIVLTINNCKRLQPFFTFLDSWKAEIQNLKTQLAEYEQQETISDPVNP